MAPSFRTCIGCHNQDLKRKLLRLVRDTDGTIHVDPEARLPGRGAYVHPRARCLDQGLTAARLARSFRGRASVGAGLVEAARNAAGISLTDGQQDG